MNAVDGEPLPLTFPAVWCGFDLVRREYSTVPPLDPARFTGQFDWLDEPRHSDPNGEALVTELGQALAAVGLALPQDFVTFHTHQPLRHLLINSSSCWGDLSLASKPLLPSPWERDAWLLRFLRDQQDCVTWYLYLRPDQTFVVHAYGLEFDDNHLEADEVSWCAPTFEQFAYRCWVEDRIADLLDDGQNGLTGELENYLDFYRKRPADQWPSDWGNIR
ncbi:hypothetical protein [Plantactinospora soyae]|uniref:SMI1/KNR4 family protein n=1 Tax=Plantactinospora soyae TaxID=1544732 RepID=A0A927R443_9ACTN|nr:hypothetical protein [Plantactinospora soyae]MBE1484666.1 hypothetical protein [Plantactinospora soyae]